MWLASRALHGRRLRTVSAFYPLKFIHSTTPYLEPPAGQLRLASPATRNFTASLIAATAKLFPSSMFSTGGDELNENCYIQDPETQQILKSTGQNLEQALDGFTQATHGALRSLGKTPVVWEGEFMKPPCQLITQTAGRDGFGTQCHAFK